MGSDEILHNFGTVSAAAASSFAIQGGFGGTVTGGRFPGSARVAYALIRNQSSGSVQVVETGLTLIDAGVAKRVEFPQGARSVTIIPVVALTSGDVTADIGLVW